jgi:hypothetical protein
MSTITEPTPLATVHGSITSRSRPTIWRRRGNSIPTSLDYASSTGRPGSLAILHVYAGGPALGPEGKAPAGTAAIDHVSLSCSGYRSYVSRFKVAKLEWREFIVPGTALAIFVYEPSGVQLELTFESSGEGEEKPDMSAGRKYAAGSNFFDKANYPKLA